jgi:hypothetical protein
MIAGNSLSLSSDCLGYLPLSINKTLNLKG